MIKIIATTQRTKNPIPQRIVIQAVTLSFPEKKNGVIYHFPYLRNLLPSRIEKKLQKGIKKRKNNAKPVSPKMATRRKKQSVENIQIRCRFIWLEVLLSFMRSPELQFFEDISETIYGYCYPIAS